MSPEYFDPPRLLAFLRAFALLEQGAAYATKANVEPQQFAVPVKPILDLGLMEADVRALVSERLLVHLTEEPLKGSLRQFLANDSKHLDHDRSCFIFTPKGRERAAELARRMDELVIAGTVPPEPEMKFKPRWDPARRELYWHVWIVKKLDAGADSQEPILQWFQERGFPEWIEYQLPNVPGVNRDNHLHNALQGLNRGQTACEMKFYRDGSKSRIKWKKM